MSNRKSDTFVIPFADEHLIEGFVEELGYLSDCGIEFDDLMSTAVACSIDSVVNRRAFEESFQDMSAVESYSSDASDDPGNIEDYVTPSGATIPLGEIETRMCRAASYIGDRLNPYLGQVAGSVPEEAEVDSITARDRVLVRVREAENNPEEAAQFLQRVRERYGTDGPPDSSPLVYEKINEVTGNN